MVVKSVSFATLRRRTSCLRTIASESIQSYRYLFGRGLPPRSPLDVLRARETTPSDATLNVPAVLGGGGGTRAEEMLYLAAVARLARPRVIFEIGTFTGLTTSAMVMNAPAGAEVITLDLPPDSSIDEAPTKYIESDRQLVRERRVGTYLERYHLSECCTQIFCDSMTFDPTPYLGRVELGFIDGAHALSFVTNDTAKMAAMMTDDGFVFWHDYGGLGEFGPLTSYLEDLSQLAPLYQVPYTSLAWTTGRDLRNALARSEPPQRSPLAAARPCGW